MKPSRHQRTPAGKRISSPRARSLQYVIAALCIVLLYLAYLMLIPKRSSQMEPISVTATENGQSDTLPGAEVWIERARQVSGRFHAVYTPCWEGAYGAIGDAYLYATTKDPALLNFHLVGHDLRGMCEGTWVDDRAWVCLAEIAWWEVTGKTNQSLIEDARRRYLAARIEGRLSDHEGFWSWYNWPPTDRRNERIFTNSNMNQMVTVACRLYEATGEKQFLRDALLVWKGDRTRKGIEGTWYKGGGRWEGSGGRAAFGNQLPWEGTGYCTVAAALYRATSDTQYRHIAVETARHILDPSAGWIDPADCFQLRMDGNGAFVNFLFDAYTVDSSRLRIVPTAIERMLEHVWTNGHGKATVVLHRVTDHSIRNGWNLTGGEDGYNVDEVGSVHAQGEAARAFGIFAFLKQQLSGGKHLTPAYR